MHNISTFNTGVLLALNNFQDPLLYLRVSLICQKDRLDICILSSYQICSIIFLFLKSCLVPLNFVGLVVINTGQTNDPMLDV
jgi:hypothetical protein